MKKIYVLSVCIMLLILSSCEFSENIYINEDGSGKMSFEFDGSQLMQMGGESVGDTADVVLDSTIVFKDFLEAKKDSIATLPKAEQEQLKALENFKMHMLMDPNTKQMVIDINTDFKNVDELEDMFKVLNKANELNDKGSAKTSPLGNMGVTEGSEVYYSYKENVFKRTVKVTDPELLQATKDSLADTEMILAASTYTLNYHFPKKIKSVSLKNVMFSEDHKSFSAELSFKDYVTNPESLNVEVVLED
ncbi:hypothetical protein [Formosa sp. PL04]|uniref:hypothetical protein n=1 Tax=Formosa sp. PL04 TaxID=3081755 RepID=UPI002981F1FE|nr:hypothetical protein [Formosa sp. PL04]MDW5287611.1 hypothetical protein [Formosa sp. PL04]